jgi:glycosyltransferase involved in cell wall biosynthesis
MTKNSAKPRLLVIGQAVKPTGYARVLRSVLSHLHGTFDVLHFAVNYMGDPVEGDYRIIPNRLMGDVFGREQIPALLGAFQPDLIFMCHDPEFYSVHEPALLAYRRGRPSARVVFYCPIQWVSTVPGNLMRLATVDRLVLYTEFGRRVLKAAFEQMGTSCPSLDVLPHGVDTDTFHPLVPGDTRLGRLQARAQLFPDQPHVQQAFIVLNANRNSQRKRVDLTVRAFAEFARDKADAYLYLHMGMLDSGYDVLGLADELVIRDRMLLTTAAAGKPDVPDEYLNVIYNACDVGLNTATGEGWGLVAFEHAATGAAQIVPDHSACAELWREHGLLIPLEETPESPGRVSISGAAAKLNQVYHNRSLRRHLSEQALAYATSAPFTWQNIAASWRALFLECLYSLDKARVKACRDQQQELDASRTTNYQHQEGVEA